MQSLWSTAQRMPEQTKTELPYVPPVPLLGIYPEKTIIPKDTHTPVVTAALFTRAKTWKQAKRPSADERIKMQCVYTMEYYSVIQKNEIMPFATTCMDLQIIMLTEVRDKYHISLLCGI